MSKQIQSRKLHKEETYRVGEIVGAMNGEPMFVFDNTPRRFIIIGTEISGGGSGVGGSSIPHGTISTEIYDFRELFPGTKHLPSLLDMNDTFEGNPDFPKYEAFIQKHRGEIE